MPIKKVLIITYYWPPTGGAGVQRWLKFSKYFRQLNWEPVIYTPSNPDFPINDSTLLKDVLPNIEILRTQINEPYDVYRKIMGKKKTETVNQGFLSEGKENKLLQKINGFADGLLTGFASIKNLKKRKAFFAHTIFIWSMYLLQIYIAFYAIEQTQHLNL